MKGLAKQVALEAVMTALTVQFPFLAIPILNRVVKFILGLFFNVIYKEASLVGAFLQIELITESERKKYDEASLELRRTIATGDEEAIKNAKEKFKNSLRDLISLR